MKRNRLSAALAFIAFTATASALSPRGGSEFDLTWFTIDSGGGTSAGGGFEVSGTIGQHEPGTAIGGAFELTGGFWGGSAALPCPGDVNRSGGVDFADLLAVLSAWGSCDDCPEDLNGDGFADFADLLIVLSAWGPCG